MKEKTQSKTTLVDIVRKDVKTEPELSYDKSDVERALGFPGGHYTSPGPVLSPLIAAALSVGVYGLLSLVPGTHLNRIFTAHGAIPYVVTFLTTWSIAMLWVKGRKLKLQRRALGLNLIPTDDPGFILTPASAEHVLEKLYESVDDPRHFLLTRRIHNALANLRNVGRVGDVDEVLQTQADNDEGLMESSYTVLRGFIWAIPVLGFIGTVWGLSTALGSFGKVLKTAENMEKLTQELQNVTGGLATAFETTLLALIAALCIHILMVFGRRREERFLDDCRDYCQKYVVGRLRLTGLEEMKPS